MFQAIVIPNSGPTFTTQIHQTAIAAQAAGRCEARRLLRDLSTQVEIVVLEGREMFSAMSEIMRRQIQ